jgi:hypothetical protein
MDETSDEKKPLLSPTLPRWWSVLPFLILLVFIEVIDGLLLTDFIEQRYAAYYQLNSSRTENSRELCLNASQTTHNSTTIISTTT